MSILSDIFDTMRANRKIDRIKKEKKLDSRKNELVQRYGISEEEAAAKARLESTMSNMQKTIGKIAPPQEKKRSDKKSSDKDMFGDLDFKF